MMCGVNEAITFFCQYADWKSMIDIGTDSDCSQLICSIRWII